MSSRLLLTALLCLAACGVPTGEVDGVEAPPAAPVPKVERITLTLEARSGDGLFGYSFAEGRLVDAAAADLVVSSSDCGARGRWVTLGSPTVRFCTGPGSCRFGLSAGGSDGAFEGETQVTKGEAPLGALRIVQTSPTPHDWYEAQPVPPFEVVVELVR